MESTKAEYTWVANCPYCGEGVDQFDECVEEEGAGDDSIVACMRCKKKYIVEVK